MLVRFREYLAERGEKSKFANRPMSHAEINFNERAPKNGGLLSERGYLIFHDWLGTRKVSYEGLVLIPRVPKAENELDAETLEKILAAKGSDVFKGKWLGESLVFRSSGTYELDLTCQTDADHAILDQLCAPDQGRDLKATWSGGSIKFSAIAPSEPVSAKKQDISKLNMNDLRELAAEKGVALPAGASIETVRELITTAIDGAAGG